MTEDRNPSRLPPPAFPSRARRGEDAGAAQEADSRGAGATSGSDDEAFYYPADGRPAADDVTFISPDDPGSESSEEEGTVTGIGDDNHLAPDGPGSRDPHLAELTTAVAKLAEALRRRGEAGLHASPEMSRFEATMRAYCVGYLAGRRAESNQG